MTDEPSSCIFCRIVSHEIPAEIVHESDSVVALRDTNPQAPTHILLIPREHVESIADVDASHDGMLGDLVRTATHLAAAEGIEETGWRLVTNIGPDGGQTVFHLHFHLLGGRPMAWPPG